MPQFPLWPSVLPMASRVKLQVLSLTCKAGDALGLACLSSLSPQSEQSSRPLPLELSDSWLTMPCLFGLGYPCHLLC